MFLVAVTGVLLCVTALTLLIVFLCQTDGTIYWTETVGQYDRPVALAFHDGKTYVAQEDGRVFCDQDLVAKWPVKTPGPGQGLLDICFLDGVLHASCANKDCIVVSSPERVLLTVPASGRHPGGALTEHNGELFLCVGDTALRGDPSGLAQDPAEKAGKILRMDGSVWASGLHDPWRAHWVEDGLVVFDRGQAMVADRAGTDFGWPNPSKQTARSLGPAGPVGVVLKAGVVSGTFLGRITLNGRRVVDLDSVVALVENDGRVFAVDYQKGRIAEIKNLQQ